MVDIIKAKARLNTTGGVEEWRSGGESEKKLTQWTAEF